MRYIILLLTTVVFQSVCFAQRDWSKVEITSEKLSEEVYVLYGLGGNIGLVIGDHHSYLIDDQFAPLTDKILEEVKKITDKPVKFVINTHHHGDHSGGNENLRNKASASIIAHKNVKERMSKSVTRANGKVIPPKPFTAHPNIVYTNEMKIFYGASKKDFMMIVHGENAHTDGDSFVYIAGPNILHTGDNFVTISYPFIDINSGGDIDGLIKNLDLAIFFTDENTTIIPGHGKVATKAELVKFYEMVKTIRDKVATMKKEGKSIEEIIASKPSLDWDGKLKDGFISPEKFAQAIYDTLD